MTSYIGLELLTSENVNWDHWSTKRVEPSQNSMH